MGQRGFIFLTAGLVCLFLTSQMVSGCGKKKQSTAPIQEAPVAAEAELPVLEQNLVYMTNREAVPSVEPDYSFTDFPNDLQPVPDDAVPTPKLD